MQAGGGYLPADMICQFGVRACADRTRATRWRVRLRLFESAIDAGARDTPRPEPRPPQAGYWCQPPCAATECEVDRARKRAASCNRAQTSDTEQKLEIV